MAALLAAWGLKGSAADGAAREGGPRGGLAGKCWGEELRKAGGPGLEHAKVDPAWTGTWCWELRTDSLLVASLVNGEWAARPEQAELGDQCRAVVNVRLGLWEKGWAPGEQDSGWATWVPRELNPAADALANLALGSGRLWRWSGGLTSLLGGADQAGGVCRAWSDGGPAA